MVNQKVNIMNNTTTVKAPVNAKFFSNASNARRALKVLAKANGVDLTTEQANAHIQQEHYDEGGRFFYVEAKVLKALVAADQAATVVISTDAPKLKRATEAELNHLFGKTSTEPKASKARSVTQNNVRRPIKGVCAEIWAELDVQYAKASIVPTIKDVKAHMQVALGKAYNENNVTIEFYGWRKFNGLNTKK